MNKSIKYLTALALFFLLAIPTFASSYFPGGGGGGGTPGGSSGQVQYNNAGAFGGITVNGDGTLNTGTGALIVTKTNGSMFANSATVDATNATNISSGTLSLSRLPTIDVPTGGTGVATLTNHGVVLGQGVSPVAVTSAGTATQVLTSNGPSADPTFQALPASGVSSVSGTANRITSTGGTTPVIDISASYVGQSSITTLGTIGTGVWQGTAVGLAYGGTASAFGASLFTGAQTISTSPVTLTTTSANYITTNSGSNVINLPAASTCIGKQFYFVEGTAITKLTPNGSDTINGNSGSSQIMNTSSQAGAVFAIISDGVSDWKYSMFPMNNNTQFALGTTALTYWDGQAMSKSGVTPSNSSNSELSSPLTYGTFTGAYASRNYEGTRDYTANQVTTNVEVNVNTINTASGSVTETLPLASGCKGKFMTFYRPSASNTATITANASDNIDASGAGGSFTLPAYVGASVTLQRDSTTTKWITIKPALVAGSNITITSGTGILTLATTGLAASGANADITSISGLTGVVANSSTSTHALDLTGAGGGIRFKSGSNTRFGTGTLSSGTATVSNTSCTANTHVILTDTGSSIVNLGSLQYTGMTAGVGFTVNSSNVADSSTFEYILYETQ